MITMEKLPTHIWFSLSRSQFECRHCGEIKRVRKGKGISELVSVRNAMYEQHKECTKNEEEL